MNHLEKLRAHRKRMSEHARESDVSYDNGLTHALERGPAGSSVAIWRADEGGDKVLFDAPRPDEGENWQIVVQGRNVRTFVTAGTTRAQRFENIECPLQFVSGGAITITGFKIDANAPASATVTASIVAGGGLQVVRSVLDGDIPETVRQVTALGVSATVTVAGVSTILPAGQSMAVVAGSVVTAGTVIGDHVI